MINRYRRAARTWAELALGPLTALDAAIPELSLPLALPLGAAKGEGPVAAKCSGEQGIRTLGTLTGTPDFESGSFGHSDSSPPRKLRERPALSSTRAKRPSSA
jgi:hypothetical protein